MPAIVLVCLRGVGSYKVQLYLIKRSAIRNVQAILTCISVYISIFSHLKLVALAYNLNVCVWPE